MPSGTSILVVHGEAELVVAARATPREMKKLSDIDDQEGLRFQHAIVMFYQKSSVMEGKQAAMVIRYGFGEALVHYYPLAGRLREGPNRKLTVDCNGEGVLFLEAEADVSLKELGNSILPPCPHMKELLLHVPGSQNIHGCPLLFVQGRPKYRTKGNYLIGDTSDVGFYDVDFGWGSPIYGGPAGAVPFVSFYGRFTNSEGEDGFVVPFLLPHLSLSPAQDHNCGPCP
ncbi:hypothetical protein VNO78_08650 [Psophocarpus tetragonolobus]|uniref:Uncharacterized protein n=1 Tax=Psophocarpus tetragonolobus TaxID=3891 RepID=A0AAN9SWC2_PSOTE